MIFYTVMFFEECECDGNVELGNYIHKGNALKKFDEERMKLLSRIEDAGMTFEDAVIYESTDYISYDIPPEGLIELWIIEKEIDDA